MHTKKLFIVGFLYTFSVFLFAAETTTHLTVQKIKLLKIKQGQTQNAVIPVEVEQGLHVHSNPPSQKNFIPTQLMVEKTPQFQLGEVIYPKEKIPFKYQNATIDTYEGVFKIEIPITVKKDAAKGKYSIPAKLRYQACNKNRCFFPTNALIQIPVQIE